MWRDERQRAFVARRLAAAVGDGPMPGTSDERARFVTVPTEVFENDPLDP